MKTHISTLKTAVFFLFLTLCFAAANAQDKQDQNSALQNAIANKQFIFNAQTVIPMRGATRQVSNDRYTVRVSGDSLTSDLPYFGRAYVAPINGEGGGIHFTSTKFDYAVQPGKKGGWNVSIHPKDATDVREFILTVSKDGYATLQALSNNRQPITFNGKVDAIHQ
jgi:Domain of unknown function (DUF4251)